MRINKETMLFEDLSEQDRSEMLSFAKDLVLRGITPNPLPDFVEQWMTAFGYSDYQRLLIISTALPQRILLSLTEDNNEQAN